MLVGLYVDLHHAADLLLLDEFGVEQVVHAPQLLEPRALPLQLLLARHVHVGRAGLCVRLREGELRALADGGRERLDDGAVVDLLQAPVAQLARADLEPLSRGDRRQAE